jgi:sulfur carrier protein
MMLRLNGEEKTFSNKIKTVSQILGELGVHTLRAAVEINGKIVNPALFEKTFLEDRDRIEIVSFVGGG